MEQFEFRILMDSAIMDWPIIYQVLFNFEYIIPARGVFTRTYWPKLIIGDKIIIDTAQFIGFKRTQPIVIKYSEIKDVKNSKHTIILHFKKYKQVIKFNSPFATDIIKILKERII
ncbi:MAG: hypothetical protein ABII01_02240 [Candidatus Woesearchaeota archaeon]